MDESTKRVWEVVLNILQLVAVVVGALWAYFRFRRERPNHPRIEFAVDCKFFGPILGDTVAAFEIHANNKGHVEHKFTEIRLKVRGIKEGAKLAYFEGREPRLSFPEELFKGVNLVGDFGYFFVRPGVKQTFTFTTKVPADIRFLVARATFKYEATNDLHTAERVFDLRGGVEADTHAAHGDAPDGGGTQAFPSS